MKIDIYGFLQNQEVHYYNFTTDFCSIKGKGLKTEATCRIYVYFDIRNLSLEQKNTSPAAESLSAIADFLGVSIDYLEVLIILQTTR